MVRQLRFFIFLAMLLLGMLQLCADDGPLCPAGPVCPGAQLLHRKRIAVVDFTIPSGVCGDWGHDASAAAARMSSLLSDMFISALANSGAFDVIERTELDQVLNEQRLDRDALLNPSTAPRLGRILGVDMILGGKLTEFGVKEKRDGFLAGVGGIVGLRVEKSTARVTVDARLIDTTTAKIVLTEACCAENSEQNVSFAGAACHNNILLAADIGSREWLESRVGRATRAAVNAIAAKFIEHFPVEASIAATLPDGSAILNIGRLAGIRPGDIFDLVQLSQVLDPTSGEVIYEQRQPLGTLQVIEVQDNGCRVKPLNSCGGNGIGTNDVAVLRRAPGCVSRK